MNLNPINLNYQDGLNTYPIIDYIDEKINTGSIGGVGGNLSQFIYTSNVNNYTQLYINNSNLYGEIRFRNVNTAPNVRDHNAKIDIFGKLAVYHTYNILNPLYTEGWKDVESELDGIQLNLTLANGEMLLVQGQIAQIESSLTTIDQNLGLIGIDVAYHTTQLGAIESQLSALNFGQFNPAEYEKYIEQNVGQLTIDFADKLFDFKSILQQSRFDNFISGIVIPTGVGAVAAGIAYSMDMGNLHNTYSNVLQQNPNLTSGQRRQILEPASNAIQQEYIKMNSNYCNMSLQQGFINSNITNTQFIPTLKSNKVMLGNITTPNSSYQMEMTGDLNTNMLYINSTSLTSLLNQKQDNLTAVSPIYITTGNIGINYDSTLLLTSGVLGVGISAESKWLFTGGNIYNKSLTNVGIGTLSVQSKLHLHQSTANTECQIRFTNVQSGNDATTDGVYMGLDGNSPYTFLIDSKTATGQIRFRTADNTRMTLTSAGKVGIGVAVPNQLLSVGGIIESTNGTNTKLIMAYDNANNYRHSIYGAFDSAVTDNNYIQFYNWRYGQSAGTLGDKSVATFHNKYSRFDGNRYFWINDRVNDVGSKDYTLTPLSIFNQTASSTTVLNDPQPVLNLSRQGTNAQSTAQNACFKLCRWENNSTNSRTRLDIDVSENANDDVNVISIRSDGKVGITSNNPKQKLHIEKGSVFIGDNYYTSANSLNTANGYKIIFDNSFNGTTGTGNIANKITLFNTPTWKAGFGVEDAGVTYQSGGGHVFYTGTTDSLYGNERMRIHWNGGVNINATLNNYAKLNVNGPVNFHAGNPVAVPSNYMSAGSLTIGDTTVDYGQGTGWNTNTAGLLLECKDKTEIVVHDSGNRLASLINYVGGASSYHEYGRAYGYGHPNAHYFRCNQTLECYFANAASSWNYFKVEPTTLWGDGQTTAADQGTGSKYLTIRNIMLQAPHVVPESAGGVAYIRYGRAGGVSAGTWWETSVGVAGTFRIIREQDYKKGITISSRGNIGVANDAPVDVSGDAVACSLHLGKCQGGYQHRAKLTIVKDDNNGSVRQTILLQDNLFNFCIADGGGQNNFNIITIQLSINYASPQSVLVIDSYGYVTMRMGYGTSDQRTKTNIKTIDDALFKVLNLRGVEYNDVEIGDRRIGLIAQEVEGVIPEVVKTSEDTDVKSIAYGNMAGLFVNAIKELNDIVVKQNKVINNLMERIERLENGSPSNN